MTPSTLRSAAETVAGEVQNSDEAEARGILLGRVVASQLRVRDKLADRMVVAEFEQVLQQLAGRGGEFLVAVATRALMTLRQEHGQAPSSASAGPTVTPRQCREARRLLGVTQAELARKLETSIGAFERTGRMSHSPNRHADHVAKLRRWFEQAGVELVDENGGGPGVRLRKTAK